MDIKVTPWPPTSQLSHLLVFPSPGRWNSPRKKLPDRLPSGEDEKSLSYRLGKCYLPHGVSHHGPVFGFQDAPHNTSLGFPVMDLPVSSSLRLSLMPCYSRFHSSSVLKVDCTMESSGGLVRTQIPGPHPRVSDSAGRRQDLRTGISTKFPGAAAALGATREGPNI